MVKKFFILLLGILVLISFVSANLYLLGEITAKEESGLMKGVSEEDKSVLTCSQADISGDGIVSLKEMILYTLRFQRNGIDMNEFKKVIGEWKNGC